MEQNGLYQMLLQEQKPLAIGADCYNDDNSPDRNEELLKAIIKASNFAMLSGDARIIVISDGTTERLKEILQHIVDITNSLRTGNNELLVTYSKLNLNGTTTSFRITAKK